MQGLSLSGEAILAGILSGVACIVWFVRLEGRLNHTTETVGDLRGEIGELRTRHEQLDSRIVEKLSNVEKSLAKIEGRLSINNSKGESN